MTQRIAATVALLVLIACVPSDRALHVLEGAGYTNISLGTYAPLACSEEDTLKRRFEATGPSGQRVSGAVCCGIAVKNCTIRTR